MENIPLKTALNDFLEKPSIDSCQSLLYETTGIVEITIKDFQITGHFNDLIDQSDDQKSQVIDRYPTPDADDVQSSVIFNCFLKFAQYVKAEAIIDNINVFQIALHSQTGLPETTMEFYRQKSLSALQILTVYWCAEHNHPELMFMTEKMLSLMSIVSNFETEIRSLSSKHFGRSKLIKCLWRFREEIVFAIDRLARKYSRECFDEQFQYSSLRYEYNLLMEKLQILSHSVHDKLSSDHHSSAEPAIIESITKVSQVINDEWQSVISEFNTLDEYMPASTIQDPSEVSVLNEVFSPLYNGMSHELRESNYHALREKLSACLDNNDNPLILFLLNKVGTLTDCLSNYDDHIHGLLSENTLSKSSIPDQLILVRGLFKDLSDFFDIFCCPRSICGRSFQEFQVAQISMAHEMLSKISRLQDERIIDCRLSVFIPLQDLITRLEYVVYEQSIFVNAYSNLLESIDDFDRVIDDLSDGKRSMVKPYANILRSHAFDYSQKVLKDVSKPRHHVAEIGTTMVFQAKMGHVIEEADQCLRIHRHPEWFRIGVRLIMSMKHFIAACFAHGQLKVHHAMLSKQFYQSDYLPSSSVFANTAIDRLTQGLVTIGHQVRH